MSIRTYLEIAGAIVLAVGFALFVHHERVVGEQRIEAADAKATAAAKALADAQTKHEQDLSNQAQQAAQNEQKAIENYVRDNPVPIIRVCDADPSSSGVPKAAAAAGGTTGTGAGPDPVSSVSRGPDIGPALGELMQDAARLAVIDREWQER